MRWHPERLARLSNLLGTTEREQGMAAPLPLALLQGQGVAFVLTQDMVLQARLRADLRVLQLPLVGFAGIEEMMRKWEASLSAQDPLNPRLIFVDTDLVRAAAAGICRLLRPLPWMQGRGVVILERSGAPAARLPLYEAGAHAVLGLPHHAAELRVLAQGCLGSAWPPPTLQAPRLLIADPDPMIAEVITHHAQRRDWKVDSVLDGEAALRLLQQERYDLAIVEQLLPFRTGIELLETIAAHRLPTRVLLLSAQCSEEIQVRALEQGAGDVVAKPFSPEIILARLQRLLPEKATPLVAPDQADLRLALRGLLQVE